MLVRDLQNLLAELNPEMEIFSTDPDRSSIVWGLIGARVEEVKTKNQFGDGEHYSHDFPIGFKFLKLY
jgi:hypothetical protein